MPRSFAPLRRRDNAAIAAELTSRLSLLPLASTGNRSAGASYRIQEFRYALDENGHRVLVGLTTGETVEFERWTRSGATIQQNFYLFQPRETFSRSWEKMARTLRKARVDTLGFDKSTKSNKTLRVGE